MISFNSDNSLVVFLLHWMNLQLGDISAASWSGGQHQSHKLLRSKACGLVTIDFLKKVSFPNIFANFRSIFCNHFIISRFHFRVNLTCLSSPRRPLETDEICLALSSAAFWDISPFSYLLWCSDFWTNDNHLAYLS